MDATRHTKKKEKITYVKGSVLIGILLLQILRICGTGAVFVIEFYRIVIKQGHVYMLDTPNSDCNCTNFSDEELVPTTLSARDEALNELNKNRTLDPNETENVIFINTENDYWQHNIVLAIVPCLEVLMTIIFIYFLLGPLSQGYTLVMWFKGLLRMRIFYMRLIWTATAIVYAVVVVFHMNKMYKLKEDDENEEKRNQFKVDGVWIAMLVLSCFEYLFLGCLECFFKMMTSETVLSKIEDRASCLPKKWEVLQTLAYYLCLFAYALRNFSLSLYFGILSVYISFDDIIKEDIFAGPTVVLQIYLAMVRGRFYGLFMHAFLSTFFVEEDDASYNKLRRNSDSNGFEPDEEKPLNEKRRRIVKSDSSFESSLRSDTDDTKI